ncbi:MAG: cytochrome P450 [Novosphingobium sp.]|nr:cytochrome P450 [Novosphingobium sp.]
MPEPIRHSSANAPAANWRARPNINPSRRRHRMADAIIPTDLVAPLFNPATFTDRARIESILQRLRSEYPLAKAEVPGYDPHWIVSKYKDVREVSRLDNIFHSGDRSKTIVSKVAEQMMRDYSGGQPHIFRTLVHMDKPDHTAYRDLAKDLFMPQSIATMENSVREIARRYIDKMKAEGPELDFAADIAMLYPLEVICNLIGLPKEDHPKMLRLTQWFLSYADPDLCRPGSNISDPEQQIKTWQIVYDEFKEYYGNVIQDRQATPRKDVATLVANGKIDGRPMDERSMISYFVILSTAGHDTTAATTANAMWTLAQRPELLAQLQADPGLIAGFVEEAIRWTTPAVAFTRSAAEDYELSGQSVKKGDLLYISYLSANRDEEEFGDPFEFRADRKPNRHIGFSYGSHICLGQHLARMEMRVFWEELIPKLKFVEMAGEGKWQQSEFVCGPKYVPIRFSFE